MKTQIIGFATSIFIGGGLLLFLRACDIPAEARGIWVGVVSYAVGDLARMIVDRRGRAS